MEISYVEIRNFKFIETLSIRHIESALILVGQNSVGKSSILSAIAAAMGEYVPIPADFNQQRQNIEISVALSLSDRDLQLLFRGKKVSTYKRWDSWFKDFTGKLPSYKDGTLTFTYIANYNGNIRYNDGIHKNNRYISQVLPSVYYLDSSRSMEKIQHHLLSFLEDDLLNQMRMDCCIFDRQKTCSHCFSCIGLLNQKTPQQLNAFETEKLLEYKLYHLNLKDFSQRVNQHFSRNSRFHGKITYDLTCHTGEIFQVQGHIQQKNRPAPSPISQLGKGMRSIYLLSLLEAYMEEDSCMPSLLLMEDPEIFLHPQLQKTSSDILYRLSKKCQVIFSTHSPNLLFPFNSRQIRQIFLNSQGLPAVRNKTSLSLILDDLGYSAADLLHVGFVFIVEGKQDKSRLPLLLEKYYSELYDRDGSLLRISIITTNSCTNIKTYANLKYINQLYLKERFLMIRDGDGKDHQELVHSLCRYYEERNSEDAEHLPRITPQNVLVLKYYSFENYFLDPQVMAQLGILSSPGAFYEILLAKWKEYLYRTRSGRHLRQMLGKDLETVEDIRSHMEEIKTYVRGHDLYNIFYGPYKKQERDILSSYIDIAPRQDFQDILDAIEKIPFFENRRKTSGTKNDPGSPFP